MKMILPIFLFGILSLVLVGAVWVRPVNPTNTTAIWENITQNFYYNGSGIWNKTGANVYLSTTSDNVGIGTTTPSSQLEIKGNGGTKIFLKINDTLASGDKLFYLAGSGIFSGSYFMYATNYTSPIFTIRGDGNVGIGGDSSTHRLEVVGRVNAYGYYVNGTELTGGTSTGGFNNDTDIRVNRLVLNTTATITKYGNDTFGYWQNKSCIIIGNFEDKSLC